MSRRVRLTATTALAAILVTGCAPPAELSFDTLDSAVVESARDEQVAQSTDDATVTQVAIDSGVTDTTVVLEQTFATLISGWSNCFHEPARCDLSRITAAKSPERSRLTDSLAFYAAEQLSTRPNEGELEWGIESLTITSADRARILTCEYDTRIFFDTSMSDTELGDIIFDATVWTRRVEWTLAKTNDAWKLWSRRIDRRSPAVRFCAP
jgi:hypothetical protein